MKTKPCYISAVLAGLALAAFLSIAQIAHAATSFNFTITDEGSGNSKVSWTVTGDLLTGVTWNLTPQEFGGFAVLATGIYASGYTPAGGFVSSRSGGKWGNLTDSTSQDIDFLYNMGTWLDQDYFGFGTMPAADFGETVKYEPGTQEYVIIPVAFTNFNQGFYSFINPNFTAPITVTLTVGDVVPEASSYSLLGLSALGLAFRRRRA